MIENKKYEKGTLGWLREQQKIKANKDGFDNVDDWLKWKSDPFNILEKKYGKEFVCWTRENKGNIPDKWINAGCKTEKEYKDKCARDAGFKDNTERQREWRHETGISGILVEANEDCLQWFGEFTENLMIYRYPGAIKMPPNNPGFDYLWNGVNIDNKGACLTYYQGIHQIWNFLIKYNNKTERFTLSGWDNRESLNPVYAWEFGRNDIVRGRPFWKRVTFSIIYTPEGLGQFRDHQIDIDILKEICNRK